MKNKKMKAGIQKNTLPYQKQAPVSLKIPTMSPLIPRIYVENTAARRGEKVRLSRRCLPPERPAAFAALPAVQDAGSIGVLRNWLTFEIGRL